MAPEVSLHASERQSGYPGLELPAMFHFVFQTFLCEEELKKMEMLVL